MSAKVSYIYHSGFTVQTAKHFLVFDYCGGEIDFSERQDRDVIVFASHNHGDHYNPVIHDWEKDIPGVRYILSDDIPAVPGAIMIGPYEKLSQHDFTVETLVSNDEGVAFVVDIDGLCIFHAGDLNWWHWEGEPDDYNEGMAESYKSQIMMMQKKTIDIAFVPVDPRLEKQYAWGINYLMQTVDVRWAVPMHFGNDGAIVDRLLRDESSAGYRDRILRISERGAMAEI